MIKTQTKTKRNIPSVKTPLDISSNVAESARRFSGYQHPRKNQAVELNDRELPSRYDATQVTLLARDPHYIHAYWDIAPEAHEKIRQQIGEEYDRSTYTLRMYDVTQKNFNGQNANTTFDVDMQPQQNNSYVNLWGDNVNYCGEIGVKTPQGQFFPIARSNYVGTPRESTSGRSDMVWMDVKENRKETFLYTWQRAKRIGQAIDKAGLQHHVQAKPGRKIYLSEDDIRAYYSKLFPILGKLKRLKRNGKSDLSTKKVDEYPRREKIEDIYIPGVSKNEFYRKFRLGDSAELLERGQGASEKNFIGASESIHEVPGNRKFFFEIWTELIVYGRTEVDAKVYLGSKNIPLRKDGTFSLRYALPDGKIPFDFTAVSQDQIDKRTITTAVERSKTQHGS